MSDFPPSKETLAEWAKDAKSEAWRSYYPSETKRHNDLAAFLRDERLAAALALWEAVEEAHRRKFSLSYYFDGDDLWEASKHNCMGGGDTAREAIAALDSALRSKQEEGKE